MSSALTGDILMLLLGPMLTTREGTTRWWWWSVARVVAGLGLLARRQPPPPPPPPPHGSGRPQHQPPPDRSTTAMADDNVYHRAAKQRGHNESSKSHVRAPHRHSTVTLRFVIKPRHNNTRIGSLLRHYTLPASRLLGILYACALLQRPFAEHRLLDTVIGYLLTPPLQLATQATTSSWRWKENGCSVGASIIDPSSSSRGTHRPPSTMHRSHPIRT